MPRFCDPGPFLDRDTAGPIYYFRTMHFWSSYRRPEKAHSGFGLVTLEQMVTALVEAVEDPSSGVRIRGVPEIRKTRTRVGHAAPIVA
jgi:hypothetical protein